MHQLEPTFGQSVEDKAAVAEALGLEAGDIVSDLPIQEVSCGSTLLILPVASRAAVDRAVVDRARMVSVLEAAGVPRRGLFLYSAEPADDDATVYSRMLGLSGYEDPATGSASGPLGAYLVHHGVVPEEQGDAILSRQGVAMGRPSRVYIDIGVEEGAIKRVRVGGATAFVGEANVVLP
jgi:trans-2,3-dihydro-3-hydroxyanthranilate isomerase